jgi:signal transduction histidine kinase
MSLRTQIIFSITLVALIPMLILGFNIKQKTTDDLKQLYKQRVDDLTRQVINEVGNTQTDLSLKLGGISKSATPTEFNFDVLDFGQKSKLISNLSLFKILKSDGSILYPFVPFQSEQQKNSERQLLRSLRATHNGFGLTQQDTLLYLVKIDSISNHFLVGGVPIGNEFLRELVGDSGIEASIVGKGFALSSSRELEDQLTNVGLNNLSSPEMAIDHDLYLVENEFFPFKEVPLAPLLRGNLIITQDRDSWFSLVSDLTKKILYTFGATMLAIILSGWIISGKVSRPLRNLTVKADELDLDKLEISFNESGNSETKALAAVLNKMIFRLQRSSNTIIEAERRATLGDMARQINHDVRNGFLPIRNVLNHLAQLVEGDPKEFVKVFNQRKSTLDSGLEYLEDLASSYAKVSGKPEFQPCKLNQIIYDTLEGYKNVEIETDHELTVMADPTSIRRIIQNLIKNSVQHLPITGGKVTVTTQKQNGCAVISVTDNGCGMDEETVDKIFNHFFTTRTEGTGLGLSIVKRLVNDCGGSIDVQSEPDAGSTFTVSIPIPEGE